MSVTIEQGPQKTEKHLYSKENATPHKIRKQRKKCKNLKRLSASKVLLHLYRKVCVHTVEKWSLLLMWQNAVKDSVVMIS